MSKYCEECGEKILRGDRRCAKCGKRVKSDSIVIKIIIAIVVIAAIGGIGYAIYYFTTLNSINNAAKTISDVVENISKDKFSLESSELVKGEFGLQSIEGTIKNNTNDTYSYVQVVFNLFDEDGNQMGTAMANINYLQANGTWKYKATALTTDDFARYELAEITGW